MRIYEYKTLPQINALISALATKVSLLRSARIVRMVYVLIKGHIQLRDVA